jgi:short-subunit dehydrogenase
LFVEFIQVSREPSYVRHPTVCHRHRSFHRIGLELAKCCAQNNFDLLIAADEPRIKTAAMDIRQLGAMVELVEADLSTIDGVDKLYETSKRIGRPVDALLANAGIGLGHAFLDQNFERARRVIDITGTV